MSKVLLSNSEKVNSVQSRNHTSPGSLIKIHMYISQTQIHIRIPYYYFKVLTSKYIISNSQTHIRISYQYFKVLNPKYIISNSQVRRHSQGLKTPSRHHKKKHSQDITKRYQSGINNQIDTNKNNALARQPNMLQLINQLATFK